MDRNDQNAIEELFQKLAQVERTAPPRDAESEAYIRDRIARQPSAPYYMAQTIVVQDQALAAAEKRIEELELRATRGPRPGAVPSVARQQQEPFGQPASGGFLAGAAQTALGVAGGWLLGSAIGSMFGTGSAQASEQGTETQSEPEPEAQEDALAEETFADDGGDFGDFGDFDV